jgi:hypothetical protein
MQGNGRDLLNVLKAELDFLENGGYRSNGETPWRPKFIFQDSPTCLNFNSKEPPKPCTECLLIELVPEERRKEKIPCRQIPLSERGDTIDFYYRTGTVEDLEAALRNWLKATIRRLESEEELSHPEFSSVTRSKPASNSG